MSPPLKIRDSQAKALGGCAECQFEAVESAGTASPSSDGPPASSVVIVDPALTDTFIGIVLVDQSGAAVPFARYIVTPPGMSPVEGTLDANGRARIEGINPGNCKVEFPQLDRRDFV